MAADYTAYEAVLKDVYTSDTLEKQFYDDNPFLSKIEKGTPTYTIGDKAIVTVHTGRSGGYTPVPRAGSNALNAADNQKVDRAEYNWTHHWFQIELETSTIDETRGNANAVAEVVDTEVDGALADMRKQLTRQTVAGDQTALIAQCTTTSNSDEVELNPSGAGYEAIVRGWLYPGLPVDIGTTSVEDDIAGDRVIEAVEESESTPSITISGANVSTDSDDYVSIANARDGTTSYEADGLLNMIGTGAYGTINPANEPTWKSHVDDTPKDLSLSLLMSTQRQVEQKTGRTPDWSLTSLKQREAFYNLLQMQVRFAGDGSLGGGDDKSAKFAGMEIDAQPDVRDGHWFMITKKDMILLREGGPQWAGPKYGKDGILEWKQGTTKVVGGLVWRLNPALKRRNSHAALTALN